MTTDDDKPKEDTVLTAYLDGRDGISARYRQTAVEQPPAGLDAVILKAAQDAVLARGDARKARHGRFALAASLLAGVMFTSSYYELRENNEDQLLATEEAFVPAPTPAFAPGAEADTAQKIAPETNQAEFEEIIVTGSRIVSAAGPGAPRAERALASLEAAEQEPDYRRNLEDWLAYIVMLNQEQQVLNAEMEVLTGELEAEKSRFAQAWPEVDLEELLEGSE